MMIKTLSFVAYLIFGSQGVEHATGYGRISCYGLTGSSGRCSLSYNLQKGEMRGSLSRATYEEDSNCPAGKALHFYSGRGSVGLIRWETGEGRLCLSRVGTLGFHAGNIEIQASNLKNYSVDVRISPTSISDGNFSASSQVDLECW
jgi:hypothetical protein